MKETKAYKTYLSYTISVVPPKIARNFKKASPSKKDSDLVPVDEEHVTKGKRVNRSIDKSSTKTTTGIVIREPPMETKSKRKEKVDVTRGKGIELLSEVALTKEAQMKEVRKKSLRDFRKTHPSGSGMFSKKPPRVDKITPTVISEGTGDKPGVPDVTNDESTKSNDEENKSDDDKTLSDSEKGSDSESNQQEYKEEVDRGMYDTTKQFSNDVQDKKADVEMIDAQQEKENLKITHEHVFEDAHVKISTVAKETEVPDASYSHSSDLASKFLNFLDIHPNDAEIVSPLDVHVHQEVPRIHTSTLLLQNKSFVVIMVLEFGRNNPS
nr:hypothetical protein [Tanacetum cinerariifolium]